MEEIYDINFVLPISALPEYAGRVDNMKRYGIINSNGTKVKITLLLGPDDQFKQNLLTGWAGDFHVKIIRTPYITAGQKFAYYYLTLNEEEVNSAPWHVKIDDDSSNDTNEILSNLTEYDPSDRLYLVTEIRYEVEETEKVILRKLDRHSWLDEKKIKHEYEACILSSKAMLSLMTNQRAKDYLSLRIDYGSGFGDQLVGIALKFCKLSPIEAGFMSVHPRVNEFSMFGGQFSHIHFFLGRDQGKERIFQHFKRLLDKNNKEMENTVVEYEGNRLKLLNNNVAFFGNERVLWTINNNEIEISSDEKEGCKMQTINISKTDRVLLYV